MSQLPLPFLTGRASATDGRGARAALPEETRVSPRLAEALRLKAAPEDRARMASELSGRLSRLLREPAAVELTDNAWTMVSYRRVAGLLRFRLHLMFCAADELVLRAVAGFTGRARRQHGRTIDAFIREHRALIKAAPQRAQQSLATRGRVHDLADIFASLNGQHFEGQVGAAPLHQDGRLLPGAEAPPPPPRPRRRARAPPLRRAGRVPRDAPPGDSAPPRRGLPPLRARQGGSRGRWQD